MQKKIRKMWSLPEATLMFQNRIVKFSEIEQTILAVCYFKVWAYIVCICIMYTKWITVVVKRQWAKKFKNCNLLESTF